MNSMELSGILFTGVVRAGIAATILGLIVLALERVLRKRLSPAWLFALYLPVVLRLLWPAFPESPTSIFNVPQWIRYDRAEVRAQSGLAQGTEMARTPHTVLPVLKPPGNYVDSAASSSVATPPVRTMHILALFWLGTSVILLLRLMVGWWRLQRSLPPKSMMSPKLVSALGRGRREFGVIRALTIIETPHVQSPCLFGLFKPRILLPIGLSDRLTALELRNVILHELAHL